MSESINWQELTPTQRDRLVAEKVFGIQEVRMRIAGPDRPEAVYRRNAEGDVIDDAILPYTTSMDAAWEVVKRFTVGVYQEYIPGRDCCCKISAVVGEPSYGIAKNPAEAICIAALEAVGLDIVGG